MCGWWLPCGQQTGHSAPRKVLLAGASPGLTSRHLSREPEDEEQGEDWAWPLSSVGLSRPSGRGCAKAPLPRQEVGCRLNELRGHRRGLHTGPSTTVSRTMGPFTFQNLGY